MLSPYLEDLITNVPRSEFTGNEEYQRRLRVLLRKKAERVIFPVFKKDISTAFDLIAEKINSAQNENIRDIYTEAKKIYEDYTHVESHDVNPQFTDPQTGKKGVLPSLHQKIALYHLMKEKRLGVFDGPGTGKTAIATIAQPMIERELISFLEKRASEGGSGFLRTVVVGPNPSKKAWRKGLIGKEKERYLSNVKDDEIMIINGGPKGKGFLEELKNKKWIVTNYDQLVSPVNGTGKLLVDILIEQGVDYLIPDEVHQIKGHQTMTKGGNPTLSGAFRKLAQHTKYLCLLTGSPLPDKMDDYGVLYHLLHPEKLDDPKKFKDLIEENPRILYTLFNERTVRRTSEDINDDLDWVDHDELIDLHPVQQELYKHLLQWQSKTWLTQARKAILDPRLVDPLVLKNAGLLGKVNFQHSSKYKRLEDLLCSDDGPVANGKNFVIFSSMYQEGVTRPGNESLWKRYVEMGVMEEFQTKDALEVRILRDSVALNIDSIKKLKNKLRPVDDGNFDESFDMAISKLKKKGHIISKGDSIVINTRSKGQVTQYMRHFDSLNFDKPLTEVLEEALEKKFRKKYKIGVIDGKVTDIEERERIVDALGKEYVGTLCTTDTGGESLDFTHASYVFTLDRDYKPKTEEQALARLIRKGQKEKVHVFRFLGKDCADEPLEEYVEKKKIIIRTAVDGYPVTEDERKLLDDVEGKQFSEMLRRGLGGVSINTLEATIDNIDAFEIKKRTKRPGKSSSRTLIEYNTTEAQELMKLIGQDPVNCWQDPEFVDMYLRLLPNLAVPVIHRARISDLVKRANNKEIIFPKKVLSEGSGPSLLYDAYQDLKKVIKANGLSVPVVVDRDISQAMLDKGSNPNKVLGNMTGNKSTFKEKEFHMVDNASISLLQNSSEVKRSIL